MINKTEKKQKMNLCRQVWEELALEFDRLFVEFKDKGNGDALYAKIYKTYISCHAQEYEIKLPISKIENRNPLERLVNQRHLSVYTHKHHGLTFTIMREAIQDNVYQAAFYNNVVNLFEAYDIEREKAAAHVFNNAFQGDDPLCQVKYGNLLGDHCPQKDLSLLSLEVAIMEIAKYPGTRRLEVVSLLVPTNLQFHAKKILAQFHEENKEFKIELLVNKYLSGEDKWFGNQWFLLTDAPHGFKHFEREADHVESWVDQMTENLIFKISGRYSFGFSNPLSVFGSTGTQ